MRHGESWGFHPLLQVIRGSLAPMKYPAPGKMTGAVDDGKVIVLVEVETRVVVELEISLLLVVVAAAMFSKNESSATI